MQKKHNFTNDYIKGMSLLHQGIKLDTYFVTCLNVSLQCFLADPKHQVPIL